MQKTQVLSNLQQLLKYFTVYSIGYLSIKLISLLSGFFLSTIITTIVGQTGDWGIIAGAVVVTYVELLSKYVYQMRLDTTDLNFFKVLWGSLNSFKIGIIYGLFVDAFKLGS